MRFSAYFADYKKQYLANMKMSSTTLRQNTKNRKGLTQWAFVPLGPTLTYTTANLKNFRKCLESNQYIDDNR